MRGPMKNQLTRKIIKDEKQRRKRTKREWYLGFRICESQFPILQTDPIRSDPIRSSFPAAAHHLRAFITSKQLQRNVAPPWIRIRMAVAGMARHIAIANCRSHER